MKFLSLTILCFVLAQLGGAKTASTAASNPTLDALPQSTIQFHPVGQGLTISAKDLFIGDPFCSADGTTYLDARLPPDYDGESLLAVSPKGELSGSYTLRPAPGLVNAVSLGVDAEGSDVYALVAGAKSSDLRDHDIDPGSSEAMKASQYYRVFILHLRRDLSTPEVIQLDLPFHVLRFAVMNKDKFLVLGFDQNNELPIVAVVDDSGQLVREIDTNGSFDSGAAMVANTLPSLRNNSPEGARLELALSATQWVHYRGSLLLMVPGSNAKVLTIRSNGEVERTSLNLPAGFVAESLVPSDNNWYVRISDGTTSGKRFLAMVDPSTGDVLRIIHSPQLPIITCVHDGNFYGIHWAGEKDNEKMFLMEATQ